MVIDKLENAYLYSGLSAGIKRGLEILRDEELAAKENGRYEVDGDNLYYIIQRYKTKPIKECRLEAHKKYIDIQFTASGEEVMGHYPVGELEIEKPYDATKDLVFYQVPEEINILKLSEGTFCILFPEDSHMPGCHLAGASKIRKVVVKVKIDD
jgi:YhcH/YjgK/YiaL family protein